MLDIWGLRHKTTVSCVVHGLTWSFCGYKAPCRFAWGAFAEDSTASAEALWCGATGGWLQLPKRTRPCPQSPCWSWSVTVEQLNYINHCYVVIDHNDHHQTVPLQLCSLWKPWPAATSNQIIGTNPKNLTGQRFGVVHVNAGAKWNLSCKSDSGHWQVFRAFISCNLFRFWLWASSRSNELT